MFILLIVHFQPLSWPNNSLFIFILNVVIGSFKSANDILLFVVLRLFDAMFFPSLVTGLACRRCRTLKGLFFVPFVNSLIMIPFLNLLKKTRLCYTGLETGCKPVLLDLFVTFIVEFLLLGSLQDNWVSKIYKIYLFRN